MSVAQINRNERQKQKELNVNTSPSVTNTSPITTRGDKGMVSQSSKELDPKRISQTSSSSSLLSLETASASMHVKEDRDEIQHNDTKVAVVTSSSVKSVVPVVKKQVSIL